MGVTGALLLLMICLASSHGGTGRPTGKPCPASVLPTFNVCVSIFGGILGDPLLTPCCALLLRYQDLQVQYMCLCDAVSTGVLGIIPPRVKPRAVANIFISCGLEVPADASCP